MLLSFDNTGKQAARHSGFVGIQCDKHTSWWMDVVITSTVQKWHCNLGIRQTRVTEFKAPPCSLGLCLVCCFVFEPTLSPRKPGWPRGSLQLKSICSDPHWPFSLIAPCLPFNRGLNRVRGETDKWLKIQMFSQQASSHMLNFLFLHEEQEGGKIASD